MITPGDLVFFVILIVIVLTFIVVRIAKNIMFNKYYKKLEEEELLRQEDFREWLHRCFDGKYDSDWAMLYKKSFVIYNGNIYISIGG